MSSAEFRQLLEAGDVDGLRAVWHRVAPKMPQPSTREQAEIVMHMARAKAGSVSAKARTYSQRWLVERMLPTPSTEPGKIATAVGISVNFRSAVLAPAAAELQESMADAVTHCYEDGTTDPATISKRMDEARARTMKALFG